jgi:uncharacterized protein (DUF1800 family)/uncharacterized protein (DUF1501 family)
MNDPYNSKKLSVWVVLSLVGACLIALIALILFYKYSSGNITDNSKNWDSTKATYLAKRVYLDPTQDDIKKITDAGSASKAVDILFEAPSLADESDYQNGLANLQTKLQNSNSSSTKGIAARDIIYTYELIHDPNRLNRKLFYLWENTFSVDAQIDPGDKLDEISTADINTLDKILYDGALSNYIDMVSKVQTTFAMGKYLNLIGSNLKDPNENYSRELMQLFLMGQYTPTDTTLSTPNYSDSDVNSLAYLLTGYMYKSINGVNTSVFNPKRHYSDNKMFLGQNVQFDDPEKVLPYIVSQRKTQISQFLSNKILKYYVSDKPTSDDILEFAKIISDNNFDIGTSLKWLFASDIMYRDQYMREDRYRSPVELVESFYTTLFGRNNYSIIPDKNVLSYMGFEPMKPGSIFGRPGFNSNIAFFSGSILDYWIGGLNRMLREKALSPDMNKFISNLIKDNNVTTVKQLVQSLESRLYLDRELPTSTENTIMNYITNNGQINDSQALDLTNTNSLSKIISAISLLLSQPEFLMNSGSPVAVALPPSNLQNTNNNYPKLVIVRIRGGLDYQQLVANLNDPSYSANRKTLALTGSSTEIGNGYYLNNSAKVLLPLIKSGQLSLISAVGLPGQVRAHDLAAHQMETGLDQNGNGIIAQLSKLEPSMNLISLTNTAPVIYNGASSLQMGSGKLVLFPYSVKDPTKPDERLTILENILGNRMFPDKLSLYYSQITPLNKIGEEDLTSGGRGTAGSKNDTQFPFLESLINKNIGNIYYLYADDSYDFHFEEDPKFDEQIGTLTKNLVDFYNAESKNNKITVVVLSEFGRTDKMNGNDGTDHGTGGGMLIMSNILQWPKMIGKLSPSTDANNWTDVVVDERDVWSNIFNKMYNIPLNSLFGRNVKIDSYPITIQ